MPTDSQHQAIVETFFDFYMPHLIAAGGYALALQSQVQPRDAKSGDAWTSVVTDADFGVQHLIEAVTLAAFPQWGFFGEERDASFNTRYFDDDAAVAVLLDPINSTRLYRDGADSFDIILSLTIDRQLMATLSYMPARGVFYGASRFEPAFTCRSDDLSRQVLRQPAEQMVLAVYRADHWKPQIPQSVSVFDISTDYHPDDARCCLNSIFSGEIGGYLFGAGDLLDIGATAFTVSRAGGRMSLPDGSEADYFEAFHGKANGELLVTMNDRLHEQVSAALRGG